MPNWVYNTLTIEGSEEEIAKVKAQLGKPIQKRYADKDEEVTNYSNPIISFWNIIAPLRNSWLRQWGEARRN